MPDTVSTDKANKNSSYMSAHCQEAPPTSFWGRKPWHLKPVNSDLFVNLAQIITNLSIEKQKQNRVHFCFFLYLKTRKKFQFALYLIINSIFFLFDNIIVCISCVSYFLSVYTHTKKLLVVTSKPWNPTSYILKTFPMVKKSESETCWSWLLP